MFLSIFAVVIVPVVFVFAVIALDLFLGRGRSSNQ
jgi:hypothetical protein